MVVMAAASVSRASRTAVLWRSLMMSSPVLRYASVLLLDVLWIDDLLCGGKAATHAERISAIWTSARAAYAAWEPTWRINAMQTTVEQSENVEMFEFGDIWRYK